jgi:hypothetical protein
VALTVNGQDGSRFVAHRAKLTQLANLKLSITQELFSADVKWTALLRSTYTPDQANAYYTESTGQVYTAPSFTKTNFKAPVITGAWGARTGFDAMAFKNGVDISWKWDLDPEPCKVDGYGTIDMIVDGFEGSAKGLPIQPTLAQLLSNFGGQGAALGALESTANADDLVLTASGLSLTLYKAFLSEMDGLAWARKNHRIGELTWRTTVPFSSGAPTARAAVS